MFDVEVWVCSKKFYQACSKESAEEVARYTMSFFFNLFFILIKIALKS